MKKILLVFIQIIFSTFCFAQKYVIILIPDGTSSSLVTLSRFYKSDKLPNEPLAIDKLFCGMIKTHCADNKFPDSAPTSTAYATGQKTIAPFIGLNKDTVPEVSIMELAKMYGYATGIVVTCEFPHATPADFLCHFNSRESNENYKNLAKQFVYNSPNLVFAGGGKYLTKELKDTLLNRGYDIRARLPNPNQKNKNIWALFSDYKDNSQFKSFECDKGINEPSLSQMTDTAIKILSQNRKGFFLMVEGSKIDWACHNNDPYAAVTEFLEFDKSVQVALDFAAKHDSTLVIVCPDHGTGGLTIGNKHSGNTLFRTESFDRQYDSIDYQTIIKPMYQIKCSARRIADTILNNPKLHYVAYIKNYYNLTISKQDSVEIMLMKSKNKPNDRIQQFIGSKFSDQNFLGWTTTGHTGEDVFLGIQSPNYFTKLTGIVDNSDIGYYICSFFNFNNRTETFNLNNDSTYYANLKSYITLSVVDTITVNNIFKIIPKNKKLNTIKSIGIIPNVNYYLVDDKPIPIKSKTLIIKLKNNYYVPIEVINLIKSIK